MSSAEQRKLFLNADGHWSTEAKDPVLRLDSELRLQPRVSNRVYRYTERGWELIEDRDTLSAQEKGLFFWASPAPRGSKQLVAFEGVCFVDRELLAGPLRGLSPLDDAGEPIADPLNCGCRFLLSADDARRFAAAIQAAGGKIERGAATDLDQLAVALEQREADLQRLAASLEIDLDFLDAASRGDFSGQIDFDQRGRDFRDQSGELSGQVKALQLRIKGTAEAERDSNVRARLLELDRRAEQLSASVEELRQGRSRAEALLARALQSADGPGGRPAPMAPVARQLLLRDLAGLARDQGLEVDEEGGTLSIHLLEGKLVIDDNGLRLAA